MEFLRDLGLIAWENGVLQLRHRSRLRSNHHTVTKTRSNLFPRRNVSRPSGRTHP